MSGMGGIYPGMSGSESPSVAGDGEQSVNGDSARTSRVAPEVADDPALVHSGQVRMAYRLAKSDADKLMYVYGLGWHYYDGTRWAFDDGGNARRAVLSVLREALAESLQDKKLRADVQRCESANGVEGVLSIASALEQFAFTVLDIDADPYLLNCVNGTLDLRTMELRAHDQADRITKITRAAYDPAALDSIWQSFIVKVLPDSTIREYLQRLIGMALLGQVTEHVLPILTGTGRNGKGTFYKAVLWALGDYGHTAEPDLFMQRQNAHPTGEFDLMGKRLIVVSESEQGRSLDEAKMKRLTGGDPVTARRMRQDYVTFEPSHQALMITNHLPKVRGDDPATWARIRVIPFDVVIPKDDQKVDLGERLQAEADAILSWAIAGWRFYREQGGLNEPPGVLAATGDYQKSSDAIGRFIEDCCATTSETQKATTSDLFTQWERWRISDGAEPLSLKAFGLAITAKGYPASSPVNGKKWRHGIGLKVVSDDD